MKREIDLKPLGKTGEKVPAIGLGTWMVGGGMTPDYSKDDYYVKIVKKAIELGMWHIDTAELYGDGHSEEIVGKAIKEFSRDEVFITTKVKGSHLAYDDVIKAAKRSLKRLNTDYIDLYLVHWPNPSIPLKETMKAMEKLVEIGLIRYIGVSNFDIGLIEEARSYLSKNDIVNVQNQFSLLSRSDEKTVIPYCKKEGITYTAYSPLGKGILPRDEFLGKIGEKYGKTAAQVALNWIISISNVITIPKASKFEHLEDNAGAMGWRLSKEDFKAISEHFR